MITYWAHFRSFRTHMDVTAVTALPYLFAFTIEYLTFLNVIEESEISFFVFLFNLAYFFKEESNLINVFRLSLL